jgi:hypothetical protein
LVQQDTFAWSSIFQKSDRAVIHENGDMVSKGNGKQKLARSKILSFPPKHFILLRTYIILKVVFE